MTEARTFVLNSLHALPSIEKVHAAMRNPKSPLYVGEPVKTQKKK